MNDSTNNLNASLPPTPRRAEGSAGFCIGAYRASSTPFWTSTRCDIFRGADNKGRKVLIKRLKPEAAVDESMVAAFKKEAAALKAVSKIPVAAVPDYVDFVEEEGDVALVQEFIDAKPLTIPKRGEKFTRLHPYEVRRFIDQMLVTLREVHRLGFVHNDIKPVNILSRPSDPVRPFTLVDFGYAEHRGGAARFSGAEDKSAVDTVTEVDYSAPERRAGGLGYFSGDVFSVGIVAIQLLTGAHVRELSWNAQGHIVLPLYQYARDEGLERVLTTMTCRYPWQRYQDVDEVVAALGKRKTGEIIEVPVERPRTARTVIAVALLVILLWIGYYEWRSAMVTYCRESVSCSQNR